MIAITKTLSQEKQTIIIRNYKTNVTEFLLYPTVSYALKNNYWIVFRGNIRTLSSQTLAG
jgi:hypothetical protein